MKTWLKPATLTISSIFTFVALVLGFASTFSTSTKASAQDASAQRQNSREYFYCETAQGIPTTFYKDRHKEVAFILWDSDYFKRSGYTPERRCREVTARLNNYFRDKSEQSITYGKMNGEPVVCITDREGGGCTGLLYTLKGNQNGEKAMDLLIGQLQTATGSRESTGSPLREGPCRTYINIRAVIEGRQTIARKVCS